uniref:Chromosome 4 open reading frame 54 n=1 Tax=Amphiprion percula TaxID=161767 RepID=A0A3P8TGF7_AMPPE
MEAAEKTLTYRDDTGLHSKLLTDDKIKGDGREGKNRTTETNSDESNYVDLDMKPDGPKTVKVTFTGEGNQLSVIKCDSSKQEERKIISEERDPGPPSAEAPLETLTKLPNTDQDSENEKQRQAELDPSDCSEHVCSESDELQYTDMYLNSKTESDDGASAVLSDHCGSDTVEDESHYITTHEIQLTELDHDVDYDLGRGTCWDFEDDNLVYSFVDYASFESDETQEGTLILEGRSQAKVQSNLGGAVVSTEQEESDLCDSDKCASSDESVCKNRSGDPDAGKIHFSIKTSSRAVNDPVSVFDSSTCGYTKHFGDRSHFSFVSSGARAGPLCDRAQYFIPAPGRQHLATKLRRKDINEYSSGASSSISELDDADKEVRNLTAKSFRSLACPYFDAINLSTSSESSVSEYGLNKWSAYVDWNYGDISRGRERSVIAHKTSSATLEMNKAVDSNKHGKSGTGMKAPQTKMYALNRRTTSQQASSSSKKIQLKDAVQPAQRGVTLNFRCNVQSHESSRGSKCSKKARSNEFTGTVLARSGCEMQYHHTDGMGDTHKRAIFASSLLKNVISKKMQFEQERKMERGEICDTYPALSPSFQIKDQGKGLQRQTSESGSGFTVNSAEDQGRSSSCGPAEETKGSKAPDDSEKGQDEPQKAPLIHSQSSAFNSLKEGQEAVKEAEPTSVSDTQTTVKEALDTSSMLTKLLFVPSCQLVSKDRDFTEAVTAAPDGSQKFEKELNMGNEGNIAGREENVKDGKAPEIKIRLRSVKENKGCTLNIASLLTPKISYNVNTFRAADDAKCHVLSAADKVPNFTVRDIRDTKCKFQTPIYHVRDVRKLVKSSYRFVSLDNSDGKCTTAGDKLEEKAKMEPVKHLLPSPIVIKCNSVKTNAKSQTTAASQKQTEVGAPSETSQGDNTPCTAGRVPPVATKQGHTDQSEIQANPEGKHTKQRQEKFTGETAERRNEPMIPKQDALEKLKAAVKTMEQLYVFDRNEWKRKTQAPHPIADSHVLSLIAREEQGGEELETANTDRIPLINATETGKPQGDKRTLNIIHVPYNSDTFKTQSQQGKTFTNKSVLHFGNKTRVSISSDSNPAPQSSALQTSLTTKSSKTAVTPLSVKIEAPKHGQAEQGKVKISPTNPSATQGCSDSENYLTIPGLGYANEIKLPNPEPVSREGNAGGSKGPEQKRSPLITEYPAATIYHHSAAASGPHIQQQVLCFSPTVPTVSPTPSTGDSVAQTQRKMLLDPTTGHYYLVDTPIQATTKRLFDPETGQYVDVPMPHSPVAPVTPVTPVTPVPLSLSPLALSPGAFAPTYMIYPGLIPSPTLAAQAVLPQSPCHSEGAGGENVKKARSPRPESSTAGAESAYYSATGEAPQGNLKLPVSLGHVTSRGSAANRSERKPVISITTQQGPRIIAPPSFDGTTMSFVVEHR